MSMEQQDLFAARARRDRALEQHRARQGDDWTLAAAQYLGTYAREVARGEPFLVEDAAQVAPSLMRPVNAKAWGAAVQVAKRGGLLVRCGFANARTSNQSPKCLWRAKP